MRVRLVFWSAVFALVGLAFVLWSVLSPTPIPVIAAMSVGQVVGTASLAMYVLAILLDLKKAKVLSAEHDTTAPAPK